ncbi:L-serine dehydratase 1 [Pseudogulbenkiania sp. NH8B]|uniref:L-serine ammonia-lyase n=1 Tax=Pseudogulbenkiania sp. (strain NH8B) TaxID=748280 RepID=UPI0002279F48|nr:L-serine ammonia-lyase [Pseudogulbenkiania sp. NH8B]BAK76165.1 L-serine dehydratase 1 [Pseudogulbenkiania sp. NH8B]
MNVSTFDLFKIGIGPSSSHTVGPMIAAQHFAERLQQCGVFPRVAAVDVRLHGALAATGKGHGTDKAVLLGLEGNVPDKIDPDYAEARLAEIRATQCLKVMGTHPIVFAEKARLVFLPRENLPAHTNGLRLIASDAAGTPLLEEVYYSVGGGFVIDAAGRRLNGLMPSRPVPHPFKSGLDLLRLTGESGLSIAQLMFENEQAWREPDEIRQQLLAIAETMAAAVKRGCATEGVLPGPLKVKRRAPELYQTLKAQSEASLRDPLSMIDWINLYAMAVNEENAAGGCIVTAPTNGAAGIIPAVLHYYTKFVPGSTQQGVMDFLLTAAAIGILYKENASISGAEVGCQGEVGVACSMAAAALTAVLGGTPEQIENAAEIGMEHNLGMTCDPVGGQVQIPCIERNAMGAIKAVNAARMALKGNGKHYVSLDKVIKTMRETGADMKVKYKETSRGGLAVNVIEC